MAAAAMAAGFNLDSLPLSGIKDSAAAYRSAAAPEPPAPEAWRPGSPVDCAAVTEHGTDLGQIYLCMDIYWHGEQQDNPPGSYTNIIRLLDRAEELDPSQWDNFTTAAWLLYSQWVAWHQDPVHNYYGKDKDQAAEREIMKGRRTHMRNFTFHLDSGAVMELMAENYLPAYFPFVQDCFKLAYKAAGADGEKVRALLNLGDSYRHSGDKRRALKAYKKVLKIDPSNQTAQQYVSQLE